MHFYYFELIDGEYIATTQSIGHISIIEDVVSFALQGWGGNSRCWLKGTPLCYELCVNEIDNA